MSISDTAPRRRVLIIAIDEIARDLRVQRQIRTALQAGYETSVLGFASPRALPEDIAGVTFHAAPNPPRSRVRLCYTASLLALSRVVPPLADLAFWDRPWMKPTRARLLQGEAPDVIIANNLEGLALAAALQDRWPAVKIIFDAHEYFLDLTTGYREMLRSVMRRRVIFRYEKCAAFMHTVCEPLAALYEKDFGRPCGVVYNASSFRDSKPEPPEPWDGSRRLRLVEASQTD